MSEIVKKLADATIAAARRRLGDLLDKSPEALAFLENRALRMAELSIQYATATAEGRPAIESSMEAVQLAIATESLNVALDGDEAQKLFFRDVLSIGFEFVKGFAKEALPLLMSGLKKL